MDRGSYERELAGRPPTSRGAALMFGGQSLSGGFDCVRRFFSWGVSGRALLGAVSVD